MRKPRILYLTPQWPDRVTSASELRSFQIARALESFGELKFVVMDAAGGKQERVKCPNLRIAPCDVHVQAKAGKTFGQKLEWLLNPRAPHPHGCAVDKGSLERVLVAAREFDLIWFFELRTANMFPEWAWERSVVDISDVPSMFEQSSVLMARGPKAQLLARLRYWSWKRRDSLLGERFSVLSVCSEQDRDYLRSIGVGVPLHVIPNGFDRPPTVPVREPSKPPRLGFIGVFDYEPNQKGIEWFVRECWPLVKREVPDARLRLVGRHSDGPLQPVGPDIDGLGWVANADEEMATWTAMVVPIQLGAGTRGKIAHAFSTKCPVVSTSLGAYGYGAMDGKEMFLADSAVDFAQACVRVVRDPGAAAAMAECAWTQFLEMWTWESIQPRVWAAAEDCLRLSTSKGNSR